MFDRLQKPFLTVETGEAYQPLRISYELLQKEALIALLDNTVCLTKNPSSTDSWNWYWKGECDALQFDSLDSFKRNPEHPVRLGAIMLKGDAFYISLPSFKRACLGVPFFHKLIKSDIARLDHVDFINKVFGLDERLPHGFTELFKEEELTRILEQRNEEYHTVQAQCEDAPTVEVAFGILKDYTEAEAHKRLPYAERYVFDMSAASEPEIVFLSFYIFLRSRELVAIKRWFGSSGYSLADAADEVVQQVFGDMNIDMLE